MSCPCLRFGGEMSCAVVDVVVLGYGCQSSRVLAPAWLVLKTESGDIDHWFPTINHWYESCKCWIYWWTSDIEQDWLCKTCSQNRKGNCRFLILGNEFYAGTRIWFCRKAIVILGNSIRGIGFRDLILWEQCDWLVGTSMGNGIQSDKNSESHWLSMNQSQSICRINALWETVRHSKASMAAISDASSFFHTALCVCWLSKHRKVRLMRPWSLWVRQNMTKLAQGFKDWELHRSSAVQLVQLNGRSPLGVASYP